MSEAIADFKAALARVRAPPRDVGRAIEAANPDRLDGIFGDAPWTNS